MLDLFLKLIDRLIDLAKRRQEINKASFTDFVAPAMADLEAVQKDYLDSFRRYRDLLEDKKIPLTIDHPVLEAIRKDRYADLPRLLAILAKLQHVSCLPEARRHPRCC
jgi:hypothetical protein